MKKIFTIELFLIIGITILLISVFSIFVYYKKHSCGGGPGCIPPKTCVSGKCLSCGSGPGCIPPKTCVSGKCLSCGGGPGCIPPKTCVIDMCVNTHKKLPGDKPKPDSKYELFTGNNSVLYRPSGVALPILKPFYDIATGVPWSGTIYAQWKFILQKNTTNVYSIQTQAHTSEYLAYGMLGANSRVVATATETDITPAPKGAGILWKIIPSTQGENYKIVSFPQKQFLSWDNISPIFHMGKVYMSSTDQGVNSDWGIS